MSPTAQIDAFRAYRFPRVSGDEPALSHTMSSRVRFSPRERG